MINSSYCSKNCDFPNDSLNSLKSSGFSKDGMNCDIFNKNKDSYNPNALFVNNTNNNQHANFSNCFTPNHPLIDQYIAPNMNEVLHNNMPSGSILGENVSEYKVNIDSKDRDINVYPNPFSFTVTFGSVNRQIKQSLEWIDVNNKALGKQKIVFNGSPNPCISREFKNVKFIKIDHLVLPKYTTVMLDPTDNKFKFEQSSILIKYKYIIMKVKEFLPSSQLLGTNKLLEEGALITLHNGGNDLFLVGNVHFTKTFGYQMLGNLTKLTIELFTDTGLPIKFIVLDQNGDEIAPDTDPSNSGNLNNIYNPIIQLFFNLHIGVIENYISTNTKYN